MTTTTASRLTFTPRPSQERGKADHGWLKTFHTFSFAMYQDDKYDQFGALRVINEDYIAATQGFGTHPHREFEIFSYILQGELTHRDSLHNTETLKRGDIQMTSTGTGIRHSEYNEHPTQPMQLLQIWAVPHTRGLKPGYYTRHTSEEAKTNRLARLVVPVSPAHEAKRGNDDEQRTADGPAPVHSWLSMDASILTPGSIVKHVISRPFDPARAATSPKKVYIHLTQTSGYNPHASLSTPNSARLKLTTSSHQTSNVAVTLGEGDGMFVTGGVEGEEIVFENIGGSNAEFVVFEMD